MIPIFGNNVIISCCQEDISVRVLKTVLTLSAEVHSGHSQPSRVDLFVRKVSGSELKLLTIFAKSSVVDV